MAHDDEKRFEAELEQALKLSNFTHQCEESVRLDEDVSIAWAEASPTAHLASDPCKDPDACEEPAPEEDDEQLAEALRISKECSERERMAREASQLREEQEVEQAKQASLVDEHLLMLGDTEPQLSPQEQEEQDILRAIEASLADAPGEGEKHVTWAERLDDAPAKPPVHQLHDQSAVTCWTLKVQSDTESRRVPVSWPVDADNETKYLALCQAAEGAFSMEVTVDMSAAHPCSDLHYVDDSGDEVGLVPASVPDFLSFGENGILKLRVRKSAGIALPAPSAPALEDFQASTSSHVEEEQDGEPEKDIMDDEKEAVEKETLDDADSDAEWVTVDMPERVYGTHDDESGGDDDGAVPSS